MTQKVNHKELQEIIREYYKTKISLMCYGSFGLGKSQVIKEVAIEKAIEEKREFKEWNGLTESEKLALFDSPEKYFVFIDIRLSEYDSSDIKGLPIFMSNNRAIEFKVPLWALFLELKDSNGFLFFDEINLATPLVLSSCYKIVLDRCVNQGKINPNWFIICAGNKTSDNANTIELPAPLKDRQGEIELVVPNIEDWTSWAIKHKIESSIIGFLNFKSSNLHKVNFDDEQKQTTPRSWERCSRLIESLNKSDYAKLLLITSSAIGEGVASEFTAFCKLQDKVNLKEILKKPEKIKELDNEKDLGMMYFLISAVADNYRDKKVTFDDIMKVTEVLDKLGKCELVALLWRLALSYDKRFADEFMKDNKNKEASKFSDKYFRYL